MALKNLILVTETFAPNVNGVARTLENLACGLAEEGVGVTVVHPLKNSELSNKAGGAGAPSPKNKPFKEIALGGFNLPGYSEVTIGTASQDDFKRIFENFSPEDTCVHIATEGLLWAPFARRAAKEKGLRIVSSYHTHFHEYIHGYVLEWCRNQFFYTPVFEPFVRAAAGVAKENTLNHLRTFHNKTRCTFAPSACVRENLTANGFENIEQLDRGVDTQLFHPGKRSAKLRAAWGAGHENDIVLINVGRLADEKNLHVFFKAAQAAREAYPGKTVRTVIVGGGPLEESLKQAYPWAHFAGVQRGEALAAHYASADVFVFPSKTETFGNVVTEAMASGLVPVAYTYAAPQQFVQHGESGFLVPFKKKDKAFIEATKEAVAAQQNWPGIRAAAREAVAHLNWASIARGYKATVEAACEFKG